MYLQNPNKEIWLISNQPKSSLKCYGLSTSFPSENLSFGKSCFRVPRWSHNGNKGGMPHLQYTWWGCSSCFSSVFTSKTGLDVWIFVNLLYLRWEYFPPRMDCLTYTTLYKLIWSTRVDTPYFLSTLWALWISRNNKVFKGHDTIILVVLSHVDDAMAQYKVISI